MYLDMSLVSVIDRNLVELDRLFRKELLSKRYANFDFQSFLLLKAFLICNMKSLLYRGKCRETVNITSDLCLYPACAVIDNDRRILDIDIAVDHNGTIYESVDSLETCLCPVLLFTVVFFEHEWSIETSTIL